ncbi:MAG: hypothetical protein HY011_06770 [Acidobacteria bacterium]|nr:hypothetical protein [Acidobacteriota bacterium]
MSASQLRSLTLLVFTVIFIAAPLFQGINTLIAWCAEPTPQQKGLPDSPVQLPGNIGNKWKPTGVIRVLKGSECASIPDSEIGLEYGLNSVIIANYTNGSDHYQVEVFEMRFPSSAYGFFTYLRSKETKNRRQFWTNSQVIRVRQEKSEVSVNSEFFDGLLRVFPILNDSLPSLPSHLPKTKKLAEGQIYFIGPLVLAIHPRFGFLKEIVKFDGGTEAVSAEYESSETPFGLLLLEFHTPQLATDAYLKIESLKATLSETARSQMLLKRVGNYVAVANPVKDMKAAEAILGELKYTAVVYWEGKTFRNIPLEYRPPDAAALEEASETAVILLRTFYWIGLMLSLAAILGTLAGSSFFYWRRYQRRKAGLADFFSDAGGTIQLNLEDDFEKQEGKLLS